MLARKISQQTAQVSSNRRCQAGRELDCDNLLLCETSPVHQEEQEGHHFPWCATKDALCNQTDKGWNLNDSLNDLFQCQFGALFLLGFFAVIVVVGMLLLCLFDLSLRQSTVSNPSHDTRKGAQPIIGNFPTRVKVDYGSCSQSACQLLTKIHQPKGSSSHGYLHQFHQQCLTEWQDGPQRKPIERPKHGLSSDRFPSNSNGSRRDTPGETGTAQQEVNAAHTMRMYHISPKGKAQGVGEIGEHAKVAQRLDVQAQSSFEHWKRCCHQLFVSIVQ
mmetsp:Transcript_16883/g.46351  ORF Transcript_16883/g.46351 Transcript_16883/m.46351 type:complete len:275 (+) Transcript_16883:535-1359(+)